MSKRIIVMTIGTPDAGDVTIKRLVNDDAQVQRTVCSMKLAHCTRGKTIRSVQILETSNIAQHVGV